MADFDQLIKDKVEKAEYSYKPSAWKRFAKRAGFKTGVSAWIVSMVAVVVVSLTVGGIAFWNSKSKAQESEYTIQQPNDPISNAESGIQNPESDNQQPATDPQQLTPNAQLPNPQSQKPKADSQKPAVNSQQPTANSQQPTPNAQQTTVNSQKPKTNSQRTIYGPPVELNVDTITQMVPTDEQLRQGNSRIF